MTTMLEKAARAMWDSIESRKTAIKPWHDAEPADQEDYLDMARAALKAIRDADQAAIERGSEVGPPMHGGEFSPLEVASIWAAMIDEILAQGEGKA